MTRWEVEMLPRGQSLLIYTEKVEADYVTFQSDCAVFRIRGTCTCYPKVVAVFPIHSFRNIKRLDDGEDLRP